MRECHIPIDAHHVVVQLSCVALRHNDYTYAAHRHLERAHVLALRLYTCAHKNINSQLRRGFKDGEAHLFPATVLHISEALAMLRAVASVDKDAQNAKDFWRCACGVDEAFSEHGGTDTAFMSTTENPYVALRGCSANKSKTALLLKVRTRSFIDRGPSISWLSVFPEEHEQLYPPGTVLLRTGKRDEAVSTCTLRSLTSSH